MTLRAFSADEQIAEIDAMIAAIRRGAFRPTERAAAVLKSVAADLRGRRREKVAAAVVELGRRVEAALKSRGTDGQYGDAAMVMLGRELVGRWPSVRQALERFGED